MRLLATAALIVAIGGLIWTISQDKAIDEHNARLRGLEERREIRESAAIVTVVPAEHLQWPRHHQDANIVTGLMVHLTNIGEVDSPPVKVLARIDGEEVGESRGDPVAAKRSIDVVLMFDFVRSGTNEPRPLGTGVLSLVVIGPDGSIVARWPEPA